MYKKILLPVDLGQEASWREALPLAVEMAKKGHGSIHLMTVVPLAVEFSSPYAFPPVLSLSQADLEAQAKEKLEKFRADKLPADLPVTCDVAAGSIYGEILDRAEETEADIIVMASHTPGLKDYFIGPNAAHVVKHARCSVLVVRDKAAR